MSDRRLELIIDDGRPEPTQEEIDARVDAILRRLVTAKDEESFERAFEEFIEVTAEAEREGLS